MNALEEAQALLLIFDKVARISKQQRKNEIKLKIEMQKKKKTITRQSKD